MHTKNLRLESEDAEKSAVAYSANKPWAVPNLHVRGYAVVSEKGVEMFEFMKSVESEGDALVLLEACFRLMKCMHDHGAIHLDFHPKNIVLSTTIKDGATVVHNDGVEYGVYCIDFETMWHAECNADAFNVVSDIWNDTRGGGMGRFKHNEYSIETHACYDVYTFCTYCIAFVGNEYFKAARGALFHICNLPDDQPLPYLIADESGQRYHTYLMEPNTAIKSTAEAIALCSILRDFVDTLAVRYEH